MTNDVEFRSVSKSFGESTVVHAIDLAIASGTFVALLGPSGCGKTTCLRMIGGFEQPSLGEVLIRGQSMRGVPAFRRPVNMVFQQYALFPHLDVERNVAYGLRQARPHLDRREIARRTGEALEMVRLQGFGSRRIHELSGGQQQRVALARALINRPAVLLLDEPLAALDKKLRVAMQIELQSLQRELAITFLLVTHDQEEALSMSDQVCVMNRGRVVQMGTPSEIYDEPANLFVADFVGKANQLDGSFLGLEGHAAQVRLANGCVIQARLAGGPLTPPASGAAVTVSVRPEALRLERAGAADASASGNGLSGTVTHRIFLGATAEYAIDVPGVGPVLATSDARSRDTAALLVPGDTVRLSFNLAAARAYPAAASTTAPSPTVT